MTITNREEIVEQLTEMLMQFDKDANGQGKVSRENGGIRCTR